MPQIRRRAASARIAKRPAEPRRAITRLPITRSPDSAPHAAGADRADDFVRTEPTTGLQGHQRKVSWRDSSIRHAVKGPLSTHPPASCGRSWLPFSNDVADSQSQVRSGTAARLELEQESALMCDAEHTGEAAVRMKLFVRTLDRD